MRYTKRSLIPLATVAKPAMLSIRQSHRQKNNDKRSQQRCNSANQENAFNNHDHDDITSETSKEKKAKASKKKKCSKAKAEGEASHADLPIYPNEPMYFCAIQSPIREMISYDKEDRCPIEWSHFCVGLKS